MTDPKKIEEAIYRLAKGAQTQEVERDGILATMLGEDAALLHLQRPPSEGPRN